MDSGLISLSHKPIKLCEDMPILLLTPCVCVCGFVLLQSTLSATSIKLSYYLCVSGFALHVPDCVSTLFLCSYLCSFFTVFIPPHPDPLFIILSVHPSFLVAQMAVNQ